MAWKADATVIIAANLGARYSGVNSTLDRVVKRQRREFGVAVFGGIPGTGPGKMRAREFWKLWRRPLALPFRIWHARRNNDMILGVFLRDVLNMPLRLVFTSASQRKHGWFTRQLIARMDALIATSQASAAYLDRPAVVIPHGIDTEEFRPAEDRKLLRERLGLPDSILVGCFGRIRPDKGTDLFVEALLAIMRERDDVLAVLTGLVKKDQRAFTRSIRERIAGSGFQERFIWPGEVPAASIPHYHRCMDVYVAPQRWEGFGVTPLEAMASGVPVVAARVGAFEQQIVDGETGYLVSPCDAGEIRHSLERLIGDERARRRMGEAGRAHVARNFGIGAEVEAINAVYRSLWAGHPAGTGSAGGRVRVG